MGGCCGGVELISGVQFPLWEIIFSFLFSYSGDKTWSVVKRGVEFRFNTAISRIFNGKLGRNGKGYIVKYEGIFEKKIFFFNFLENTIVRSVIMNIQLYLCIITKWSAKNIHLKYIFFFWSLLPMWKYIIIIITFT